MNKYIQTIKEKYFINKNFEEYIKKIPILSREEEYYLAKKFKEENNLESARILIESNIKNVIKIAKNYSSLGIMISDLIQEGTIGLMKAVKRFNPDKGVRLISFAIYLIKSEIHEYIIKNFRIVKIATTKTQKKLFFNLKKIKRIGWLTKNEIKSISNTLKIKDKEIKKMDERLNKQDIPFNIISYNNENTDELDIKIPENYLKSIEQDPHLIIENINWKKHIKEKLKISFNKLDNRSKSIIKKRWLNKKKTTLKELANIYKISPERVRQLENNAIKKLKENMNIII